MDAGADDDVLRAGAWLMELEATYAPDLVHLNGYAHAACRGRRRSSWSRTHACCPGGAPCTARRRQEWDGYRRRTAAGLRAADLVVAPTRAFLRSIQSVYGPEFPPG